MQNLPTTPVIARLASQAVAIRYLHGKGESMRRSAYPVALGGLTAALALVLMCLGTLIPLATYVCPMLCCLVLQLILPVCGKRLGWGWYGAVGLLGLLLAPDKEAAAVFVFLGYYPLVKSRLDTMPLSWLFKGLLFNAAILAMYWLLIHLMGMGELAAEFGSMGLVTAAVALLLGNLTFFLLDRVLKRLSTRR